MMDILSTRTNHFLLGMEISLMVLERLINCLENEKLAKTPCTI
jgi:hypothetical protein